MCPRKWLPKLLTGLFLFTLQMNSHAQTTAAGQYTGENNGIHSSADLKVENGRFKGLITINGKKGTLTGSVPDTATTGTVYDQEMGTTYQYTGYLSGTTLHISITFPELNNAVVELIMQKEKAVAANGTKPAPGKRDSRLVGTWRYTEVINSGSGGNFGSFSSDYFMEFKADGTVYSWSGSATASGGGNSFESNGSGNKEKGEWFTEGNKLILTDPVTRQSATVLFAADQNRIMLHNGGATKKIWERIR